MAALQFAGDESATFGFNIWRGDAGVNPGMLLAANPAADIIVIRDTAAQMQKSPLLAAAAIDVELRDHILSFKKELRADNIMSPTGIDCELQSACAEDSIHIKKICDENFAAYPGHYQLSPYLEGSRAAGGMVRWLEQLRAQDPEGIFLVRYAGAVVGVLGYDYQQHTAELAIAAISAIAGMRQRNLLLVEATRLVEQRLMQRGLKFFIAKTQATNTAIQRDLVRYVHCEPAAVFATAHMHLFLGRIEKSGVDLPLTGQLHDSLILLAKKLSNCERLLNLHAYQAQGSRPSRFRAVLLPRRDETKAVFFAGYDATGAVVSVASVFCR